MSRTGRRSGTPDTREAILTVARRRFATRGYDATSLRGIAAEAGVDPALVIHYFGTKEALFVAATGLPAGLSTLLRSLAVLPEDDRIPALVRGYLHVVDSDTSRNAILALVRSAVSNDKAATMLREFLTAELLPVIAGLTGHQDARLRASLVAAQLMGIAMVRHVIKAEPLARASPDEIVTLVTPAIDQYLRTANPRLPPAGESSRSEPGRYPSQARARSSSGWKHRGLCRTDIHAANGDWPTSSLSRNWSAEAAIPAKPRSRAPAGSGVWRCWDDEGVRLGILCGGGPAPRMNSVISAATIAARNSGWDVVGITDGFQHLIEGRIEEARPLSITDVSRIHVQGGSIIRTARANPTVRDEGAADPDWRLHACLEPLRKLGIGALVTIGGDDTAFSASRLAEAALGTLRVAHVPKTIDNDLPLPGGAPTFGFETARSVGVGLVNNLVTDAMTTQRWYLVVAMGRSAGHLALGIGKSAAATLTLMAEEFPRDEPVRLSRLVDVLETSMLKRIAHGRPFGVAVLAEGIGLRLPRTSSARPCRRSSGTSTATSGWRCSSWTGCWPSRSRTVSRRGGRTSRSRVRTSATSCGARPPSRSTSSTPATSATAPSAT